MCEWDKITKELRGSKHDLSKILLKCEEEGEDVEGKRLSESNKKARYTYKE